MLRNNVMANEQPQTGSLAGTATRIERLEYVVQNILSHTTAGVGEHQFGSGPDRFERDRQYAARIFDQELFSRGLRHIYFPFQTGFLFSAKEAIPSF